MKNKVKKFTEYKSEEKEEQLDKIEIVSIQDISLENPIEKNPDLKEAMIVNADFGGKEVKSGDIIWITALIKKNSWNINSTVVLKTRIVDIHHSLSILNTLK